MIAPQVSHDPLDRITRVLVEKFRPLRVALFGSRARGDARPDSDYDIMVVVEDATEEGLESRMRDAVAGCGVHVEIVIHDLEEFEADRGDVGTFVYAVENEGRILYGPPLSPKRVREPEPGGPRSLGLWIRRADNDFRALDLGLKDGAPPWDTICFHAHQGIEKLLKSALIAAGTPPPRTHELKQLLARCPVELREHDQLLVAVRVLSAMWPKSRYPKHPEPTAKEGREAVARAQAARDVLMRHLKRA